MDAPSTENQGIQPDPLCACGWSSQDYVEVHTKAKGLQHAAMDASSTENQGIQSDPLYACGWSFQYRVEVHTKAPRSFTSTLTSTPLCRSSCLHPHLMTYPVEVYFASNANVVIFLMTAKVVEVMRNTSGTAPDFPNVELKSADSMFLALILYLYHLSWQRKDRSMKWTSILPINLITTPMTIVMSIISLMLMLTQMAVPTVP